MVVYPAAYMPMYRRYIDLLLDQQRPGDAFHILERSRVQVLLQMLAERDLVFGQDLPESLERESQRLTVAYDRTQARLGGPPPVPH